jgi:hypothetical protein
VTIFGDLNMGGSVGGDGGWPISEQVLDLMNNEDTDFIINAGDIGILFLPFCSYYVFVSNNIDLGF